MPFTAISKYLQSGSAAKSQKEINKQVRQSEGDINAVAQPWSADTISNFSTYIQSASASPSKLSEDPLMGMLGSKGMGAMLESLGAAGTGVRDKMTSQWGQRIMPALAMARAQILEPWKDASQIGMGVSVGKATSLGSLYGSAALDMASLTKQQQQGGGGMPGGLF